MGLISQVNYQNKEQHEPPNFCEPHAVASALSLLHHARAFDQLHLVDRRHRSSSRLVYRPCLVVALALLMLGFFARINPLRAQDRTIRLEETLRFQRLLPGALALQAAALKPGQLIALRFAPDDEVEALVTHILAGKLSKPAEIKKAIKNWRADYFRI